MHLFVRSGAGILLALTATGCGAGLDLNPQAQLPLYAQTILNEPGLVSYWRLSETSGTTLKNAMTSPAFSDVTLSGIAGTDYVLGTAGPSLPFPDPGIQFIATLGGGLWSGGQGDGAIVGGSFPFNPAGFSFETWVNFTHSSGGTPFVHFASGTAFIRFGCSNGSGTGSAASTGAVEFAIQDSVGGQRTADEVSPPSTGGPSTDGKWHHVVGVLDSGGVLRIYRDGADVADTTPFSFTGNFTMTTGPNIDYDPNDSHKVHANATLSNIAVYNTALSGTQVKNHYLIGTQGHL